MTTASRAALLLSLALTPAVLAGCAGLRNYTLNRVADAADVVRADVSWAPGTDMGFHLMATRLLRVAAYSYDDLWRAGLTWGNVGVWQEDRETLAVSLFGRGDYAWRHESWTGIRPPAWYSDGFFPGESWDEIGVGAHLFAVGARVGLRPWQALDFLLGLVTIDIVGDDLRWSERRALRAQGE